MIRDLAAALLGSFAIGGLFAASGVVYAEMVGDPPTFRQALGWAFGLTVAVLAVAALWPL